jgi:hypothetical protein
MVNWLITGSVLHGMPFSLDLSPPRSLKVSSERSRLAPLSTKSGWFVVTGHYGSSIFTAIHSVLSVPCLPTAATAAASKPFQWLNVNFTGFLMGSGTETIEYLEQGHVLACTIFMNSMSNRSFLGTAPIHIHMGMTSFCVYPCTNSPRSSMSRTSRVWTWKKHFWAG